MESSNIVLHTHTINKNMRQALMRQKPFILWFTGLSGSGKSSIANVVEKMLFENGNITYLLDGDNVRRRLNKDLGFDEGSRVENIRRIGEVSNLFLDAGIIVLSAFISPFREDRRIVRNMVETHEFIEVFVDVPLEVCESRDPKGLYKKARKGELKNFTGIDAPYEIPENPEIYIQNHDISIEKAGKTLFDYLLENKYISLKA